MHVSLLLTFPLPLSRLASGMSEEDYTILKAALSPAVTADDEQVSFTRSYCTYTHTKIMVT